MRHLQTRTESLAESLKIKDIYTETEESRRKLKKVVEHVRKS